MMVADVVAVAVAEPDDRDRTLALPLDPADMPDVCRPSSVQDSWLADDSGSVSDTSARPGGWLREE